MDESERSPDPRGLMREAYRMDLGPQDCRTVFLDWALGLAEDLRPDLIRGLLAQYGDAQPGHPMTAVLREGLAGPTPRAQRRGGWRARR